MNRDDLDRLLADKDDLLPSPGFAASVMDAVRHEREASAPPAPFPWTRALPGLIALAVALTVTVASGFGASNEPAIPGVIDVRLRSLLEMMMRPEVGWLALVTVVTILPAVLSVRLMRGHV